MINIVFLIALVSLINIGIFFIIRQKVMWIYRGVFFIISSCLYFIAVFYIAKLMQENLR